VDIDGKAVAAHTLAIFKTDAFSLVTTSMCNFPIIVDEFLFLSFEHRALGQNMCNNS
jgi:hypothetical protein